MNDPSAPQRPEVPSPIQVASWERLGVLPTEKVPLWAAYWIAAGHDGEALIYLAGLHGDDPVEVHDALPEALRDCGVEMPDPDAGTATVAFTDLARREVNGLEAELSPGERLQYDRAVLAGRDISAPVRVTYFLRLGSPGDRPVATEEALSAMGITDVTVDEEISGDGWWHVAAFPMLQLTPEAIVGAKRLMMRLAAATGIRYQGWHVTLNGGEERQLASRRPDLAHITDLLPPPRRIRLGLRKHRRARRDSNPQPSDP
jgi:Regulator of ribonuclease activity B